jgi:hypothetical protein
MKPKFKKIHSLIVPLLFAFGVSAQAQLLNETFDSSAGFTITDGNSASATFLSDGFDDYFGIFDGVGDGGADFGSATTNPSGTESYTNFDDNYLVNEDFDGDGAVLPYTLTWTSIPLSGETFLEISADFASTRADADDYIVVSYRLDGGAWIEILGVAGASGTNGPVFEITDFAAQNGDSTATAITSAFANVDNTITLDGTENALEIKAEFSNNNGDDNFGMDNLVVLAAVPPSVIAPTELDADSAPSPNNKDSIAVSFIQNLDLDDVLIVYSTEDVFGTPVDSTTYTSGDTLAGGGTVAGIFSSSPAAISGLAPGTTYFFVGYSINGSGQYSEATASASATTATFALQISSFSNWTAVDVLGEDTWEINGNSASASGFDQFDGGTNPEEDWLISPVFDLDSSGDETFEFDYRSQFVDPAAVGLELFYTNAYTGDPATTSWTPFTTINSDFDTNKSLDNDSTSTIGAAIDLTSISGTTVRLAFKYTTGGVEVDARTWELTNPLISGNSLTDEAISLAATSAVTDEGQTITITLSVPTSVGSDTTFFLSSNGDGTELGFPSAVTILSGADNVDFTVTALTDGLTDGDTVTDLIANRSAYSLGSLAVTVNDIDSLIPAGDIVISQYYEGASNNKYVELTNVSGGPINMSGYVITRWGNERSEEYKTATEAPADNFDTLDLSSLGTLDAGETVILANEDATTPIPAIDTALTQGFPGALTFNGNDSVVLYSSSSPVPANIVDAIGFTVGNEGIDTSFIRSSLFLGYDLSSGSNATSAGFATVWTEVSTASVDSAALGEDAYLGSTDLVSAPSSVRFVENSLVVNESDGTVSLDIVITSPDGTAVSVDVVFNSGNSTAVVGDIGNYTTQKVSFGPGAVDGDTETVVITLTDDLIEESTETASFDLGNLVTSGATTIVEPSTATVTVQDDDTFIPTLIISEVADPSDTFGARYVEIYNPGPDPIDLSAGTWTLTRYTNANPSGADTSLTGSILPGGTYIVANNTTDFALYGVGPEDQASGFVSGNGDDTYALYFGGDSSSGLLVDLYGAIGTDGTGQPWEYEDSRAYRNTDEITPSSIWNAAEWTIEAAAVTDMTPRVHPESDILVPTGVSASTQSDTEIEIGFATTDSNNVVIVFNETGIFSSPTGTAVIGQSLAGGTVLYQGSASPQTHTGLTSETQYFYAVYSINGSNEYSNPVRVNATTEVTPLVGVINLEDFEDPTGDADDWFNATVTGDDPWDFSENDALVDGLTTDNGAVEEHYLVSPSFNFTTQNSLTLTFDYAGGFDVASLDSLELVYSTDYSGSGNPESSATWTPITFAFTNVFVDGITTSNLVSSGPVALPVEVEGESTVYLAFRYNSDGTLNTEQWLLDNIVLQGGGVSTGPLDTYLTSRSLTTEDLGTDTNGNGFPVLVEYLSGFGDGIGPDVIEFGIVADGASQLALTLTNDLAEIPAGISIELLATNDLAAAFGPVGYTHSVIDNLDGTYTHSFTENSPPVTDTRFLRLSITAN